MRLGKVKLAIEYVVDLDDETMVTSAQDCIVDDIYNAVKYSEVAQWLNIEEDKNLSESDIPEFLREEEE
jgi:hypothetical protein